jgi:hypothetical protein
VSGLCYESGWVAQGGGAWVSGAWYGGCVQGMVHGLCKDISAWAVLW